MCIEGINGAGKTRLAQAISEAWSETENRRAIVIDPVQASEFGLSVREAIMADRYLDPAAEALAFASARLNGLRRAVLSCEAEDAETLVVLERWSGAVVAYGLESGVSSTVLGISERLLDDCADVNLTVLLDTPGLVAHGRLECQSDRNRFETRGAEYLERVRIQYMRWAEARGVQVVDGGSTVSDTDRLARDFVAVLSRHAIAAS